jgi:hypothetical protein
MGSEPTCTRHVASIFALNTPAVAVPSVAAEAFASEFLNFSIGSAGLRSW